MQLSLEQEATIAWSALSEPGDGLAFKIFEMRGSQAIQEFRSGAAQKLWSEDLNNFAPEYLFELPSLLERISLRLPGIHVPTLVERAIRWGAKPVFPEQLPKLWSRFEDLENHQPYLLWVAGNSKILELDGVSIVGSRQPSARGISNTQKLVRQLGSCVVSGGARGIDAAAHEAALKQGLPTLAFMAGGLDRAYPMENWNLFHQMVRQDGALVSEMVPFTAPSRFRFLQRNRLIAAATDATFVVEAGYRSGSRNTANHARALGRDVYAIPGGFGDQGSQGCNAMIKEGLAKAWSFGREVLVEPTQNQKRVMDARMEGSLSESEIAKECGMSQNAVRQALKELELIGEIIPAVTKS